MLRHACGRRLVLVGVTRTVIDLIHNDCSRVRIIKRANQHSYQLPKVGLGTADCMVQKFPKNTFSITSYVCEPKLVPDVWVWSVSVSRKYWYWCSINSKQYVFLKTRSMSSCARALFLLLVPLLSFYYL